jgi:F-type H+-transporting ATPase subunit gamma
MGVVGSELNKKIKSLKTTKKIVRITELSTLSKLGKYREYAEKSISYYETIFQSMNQLSQSIKFSNDSSKNIGIIIVTSNKGFCGSYNLEVLRVYENLYKKINLEKNNQKINFQYIVIGKIGLRYLKDKSKNIYTTIDKPLEEIDYEQAILLTTEIVNGIKKNKLDEIYAIYTEYLNPIKSEAKVQKIFPFQLDEDITIANKLSILDFEESQEKVKTILLENYLSGLIYSMLLYSIASEYCARRIAMKNANDNISEKLLETIYLKNKTERLKKDMKLLDIIMSAKIIRKDKK